MNRLWSITVAGLSLSLLSTMAAMATDVGMPLYSTNVSKYGGVEFYYERYDRDIKQGFLGNTDSGKQEENRFIARINYHPITRVSLYVEGGSTDSDGSEGPVPILGGGLKVALYDKPVLQVSAFASDTYVNQINYKHTGFVDYNVPGDVYVDHPDIHQKESYSEINGGLLVSKLIKVDQAATCTPYGGVMVSQLDGNEHYTLTYHVNAPEKKDSEDMKSDGMFAAVAGLGVTLGNAWGMRIEGRFVDQASFSAGLSYYF